MTKESKKSVYLQELLEMQNNHSKMMHQIVIDAIQEQETLVKRLSDEENNIHRTFGEKITDAIASFGGSWKFIIMFFIMLTAWMFYNTEFVDSDTFDPYPFILLNLVLSCLAAVQAPVILMSQNRKENRENIRAKDEYHVNLRAELKNRAIDKKLDLFINEQFKQLIEVQKVQIKQLDELEEAVTEMHEKLSKK